VVSKDSKLGKVDLGPLVDHVVAPMWFQAEYGHGTSAAADHKMLCPVCGTAQVHLRRSGDPDDAIAIYNGGGAWAIPTDPDIGADPKSSSGWLSDSGCNWLVGVGLMMVCKAGHNWELCILEKRGDTGIGRAHVEVRVSEEDYERLFPEAKERWDG
jgi:hypothetical protein